MGAVRRVARRAVRQSAVADPLPPARSELLRLAARRPGIGVAEAAAELRLAPNSVSTMVSKLTEDGLLNRGRVASDGRSVRLTVTAAGAAKTYDGTFYSGGNGVTAAPGGLRPAALVAPSRWTMLAAARVAALPAAL